MNLIARSLLNASGGADKDAGRGKPHHQSHITRETLRTVEADFINGRENLVEQTNSRP